MANNKPISNDTRLIVTVLLLIFLYPVGVLVMWLWTTWKVWVKILVTLPLIFVVLIMLLGIISSANPGKAARAGACMKQCNTNFDKNSQEFRSCKQACVNSNIE